MIVYTQYATKSWVFSSSMKQKFDKNQEHRNESTWEERKIAAYK